MLIVKSPKVINHFNHLHKMKINPFKPNSPSRSGMFVGRINEIEKLEASLIQTRANQSVSFLLTGERGIGKTSLLNLIKFFAEGYIEVREQKLNFLVVEIDITKDTTRFGLIKKIELALSRKLAQTEKTKKVFNDIWNFVKKFEVAGVKYNDSNNQEKELLFEEFSYSLADTLNRITNLSDTNFDAKYDGILLLIDEADNASDTIDLGVFVKLLTERLQKEGSEKLMFGIAGLPRIKDILIKSHPSSLRIFEEIELDRLNNDEIKEIIQKVLENGKVLNDYETVVDDKAQDLLVEFSEGFPHFIHQYGYCAFELSDGKMITTTNVINGAFGKRGALELIGNKYYKDDYYNKLQVDSYRQVLNIMAESMDGWITKSQIKTKFKGNDATLNNAITALRKRNIILSKQGSKGTYRLQDKGFAWWILMNCKKEEQQIKGTK